MSTRNNFFDSPEYSDLYAKLSDGSKLNLHRIILAKSSCDFLKSIIKYPQFDTDSKPYIELTASDSKYIRIYIESIYNKNRSIKISSTEDFIELYKISHAYIDKTLKHKTFQYFFNNIKEIGDYAPAYLFEIIREISLTDLWNTDVVTLTYSECIKKIFEIYNLSNMSSSEIINNGFETFISDSQIMSCSDPLKYATNFITGPGIHEYILRSEKIDTSVKNVVSKFSSENVYFGLDDFHSVVLDYSLGDSKNKLLVTSLSPFKYRVYYPIHHHERHQLNIYSVYSPILNYNDCNFNSTIFAHCHKIVKMISINDIKIDKLNHMDDRSFMVPCDQYSIIFSDNPENLIHDDYDGYVIMCKYN